MNFIDLFENHLSDDIFDRAAKQLLTYINGSESSTSIAMFNMGCRSNPYEEEYGEEECFNNNIHDYCLECVRNVYYNIYSKFRNGRLTIWRMIIAPPDWKPDLRHPGIYWSYDENAAEAHWGNFDNGNVNWLLKSSVTFNQIDWASTLSKNADPEFEDEKEITIFEGIPIKFTYKRK
jgi:hypothetical protein